MENESKELKEASVPLTNIQISKIKNEEIMRRLKDEETQKARALLATAMSHLEAYKIVKNNVTKKLNGNGKIK